MPKLFVIFHRLGINTSNQVSLHVTITKNTVEGDTGNVAFLKKLIARARLEEKKNPKRIIVDTMRKK